MVGISFFVNILLSIISGVIVGLITFRAQILLLYIKRSIIKSQIQSYLPYTLMMFSLYAAGGYQTLNILSKSSNIIKEENTKTILHRILSNIEKGESIDSVLLRESITCPSPELGNVLEGLSSISISGVGTLAFLRNSLDNYLKRLDSKLREKIDKISIVMEGYMTIGLLFPLLIEVILIFFGSQLQISIPPVVLLIVVFFIIIPVLFIVTIILLDAILSEVKL